jgi:thiol-disulfide isomerase/thioredoxin
VADAKLPDATPAPLRWYRVEAEPTDTDRVPFLLGVDPVKPRAVIDAGDEQLELTVVSRDPLALRIPVRGIGLTFDAPDASGRMRGTWEVSYYFKRDFDLTAEPIPSTALLDRLFPASDPPAVDLSGTWRIDIKDFGVGRAVFKQDAAGKLTGTFIPPEVGDLRHLLGRVSGTSARLSVFDGIHGFIIAIDANKAGDKLTGTWVISGIGTMTFTATRALPPPTHLVVSAHMAPGKTHITLPELDAQYKGKPVIVDFFGTWCPVCIDLTPQLVLLHKKYAAEGLQILSIALEPPGDNAETQRRLDEFRTQFGVTWPFKIRYTDDFNGQVPPEVLDATGFPVTIFIRRDGTVADVHTGFISDAASDEHAAIVKRFDELAAEIVHSPAPR